jgi:hypothetical protein
VKRPCWRKSSTGRQYLSALLALRQEESRPHCDHPDPQLRCDPKLSSTCRLQTQQLLSCRTLSSSRVQNTPRKRWSACSSEWTHQSRLRKEVRRLCIPFWQTEQMNVRAGTCTIVWEDSCRVLKWRRKKGEFTGRTNRWIEFLKNGRKILFHVLDCNLSPARND